jgi:hypothetical protein
MPAHPRLSAEKGQKMKEQISMRFRKSAVLLVAAAVLLTMTAALTGCSDSSSSEKKDYIASSKMDDVLDAPDDYAGKYIKVGAQVSTSFEDGDDKYLQCYADPENYKGDFVVKLTNDADVSDDDFVMVDGKIVGNEEFETIFGAKTKCLEIEGKVKKGSYEETVGKALKTRKVNKKVTEQNVTMTVKKVEFAKNETRIYINAKNGNSGDVDIYDTDISVTQDGKQIDTFYNSAVGDDRPTLDTLSGNAEKDAVLTFQPMDPDKKITLKQGISDGEYYNWDSTLVIKF